MPMTSLSIEALGWVGVALYVVAYYLVSAGRVSGRSRRYQTMNLIGAFGVAANAFHYGAYPSAIVNVIWFAIAAATLIGVLRADDERDPGHPESAEGRNVHRFLFFAGSLLAVFGLGLVVLTLSPRPPKPLQPVLVYTSDWEPYVGRSLPGGGPLAELVKDVFRGADLDARLQFVDWDDALLKVESGAGAAAFPFIKDTRRAERVAFSDPLIGFQYVLFYKRGLSLPGGARDEAAIRDWLKMKTRRDSSPAAARRDGKPWRLGAVKGYALWPSLAAIASVDQVYSTPAEAFRGLKRDEIQLLAESLLAGMKTLQDPVTDVDAGQIAPADIEDSVASSRETLHLVVRDSEAGRSLRDRLNQRIAALRESGELRRLERRVDWAGRIRVRVQSITEAEPALPSAASDVGYRLPAGSRAVVLQWPEGFSHREPPAGSTASSTRRSKCLVKLLSGPLRGWEVYVDPSALEIVETESSQ